MHDLESLTVHRAPMLLVDELLEYGEDHAASQVIVRPDMLFLEKEGLPSWVGIELMAQTVSIFAGMRGKIHHDADPKVGFLLGTRHFHAPMSHFPIGTVLYIHIQEYFVDDTGLGQYACRIQSDSGTIEAKLNVYQPNDALDLVKDTI